MMANDVLTSWAFATFLVTSVVLVVLVAKAGSSRALDASKRHDAEAHREALKAEAERTRVPPVLYLRSFADDDSAARRHGALTEEEQLAKALAWIGPLFAVGKPGETLPQVGAQRIYVGDDQWQARVSELMAQARLVVLRTGSTGGFRWEVERALAALTPDRLLLVADDARELRAVLHAIAGRVGRPVTAVRLRGRAIATVKGLVDLRGRLVAAAAATGRGGVLRQGLGRAAGLPLHAGPAAAVRPAGCDLCEAGLLPDQSGDRRVPGRRHDRARGLRALLNSEL